MRKTVLLTVTILSFFWMGLLISLVVSPSIEADEPRDCALGQLWNRNTRQCIPASTDDCKKKFLTFPVWYQYLPIEIRDGTCNVIMHAPDLVETPTVDERGTALIQNRAPLLIAAAVVEIALRIAIIMAVVFVIIGGYQMMTSSGNPESVANSRNKIINGLIGFLIAVMAISVVSFLAKQLLDSSHVIGYDPTTNLPIVKDDGIGIVNTVLGLVYRIAGAISVIFVALSGFHYATSSGDPQKTARARSSIIFALIGLAIVIFAVAIITMTGGKL